MIVHLDGKVISALLYQSLVTASFGFVAWNTMLLKYGAVALHSFIFIMPIAGVLLGGLILGEPITWELLTALALIVSGIVIVNFRSGKYAQLFPSRGPLILYVQYSAKGGSGKSATSSINRISFEERASARAS